MYVCMYVCIYYCFVLCSLASTQPALPCQGQYKIGAKIGVVHRVQGGASAGPYKIGVVHRVQGGASAGPSIGQGQGSQVQVLRALLSSQQLSSVHQQSFPRVSLQSSIINHVIKGVLTLAATLLWRSLRTPSFCAHPARR
jgi:hypothetical protein